jgi:hypothetical protein
MLLQEVSLLICSGVKAEALPILALAQPATALPEAAKNILTAALRRLRMGSGTWLQIQNAHLR